MPVILEPIRTSVLTGSNTSTTVVNTSTETSFFNPVAGTRSIPGNWFQPGWVARLIIRGTFTTGSIAGTTTFRVKLNGTTVITAATSSLLSSVTNASFVLTETFQCYTIGTTGTLGIAGDVRYPSGLLGQQMASLALASNSTTIDTTAPISIDVTAQYAGVTGTNTITAITSTLEAVPQALV